MADDDEKKQWEIIYWPLKNRGNFIKLVLEEANVKYTDCNDMNYIKSMMRSDKYGTQKVDEGGLFQAMGLPVIQRGDFNLSQSISCMTYLAEKYGVCPKNPNDKARANMIANNCENLMGEMYGYPNSTKEELFEFVNGRFQVWLDILEKPLKAKNGTFYFDERCTFADLAMFNIMDGIEELFGADSFEKYVRKTHPYLVKIYEELKQRKAIRQLMAKQAGMYSFAPAFGWDNVRKMFRSKDTLSCFKSDEIIPDVVDGEPLSALRVQYGNGNDAVLLDAMGQTLTPLAVQDAPKQFSFKGCEANKLYALILTDPDARDRAKHEYREWIHFVKINANGADLGKTGDALVEYVGSAPPKGSGIHRYVWLIYEQKNGKIDADKCGQQRLKSGGGKGQGRGGWKARKFVKDNQLGPLVAGTYYYAEYDEFVPKLYAWMATNTSYKSKKSAWLQNNAWLPRNAN